MATLNPLFLSPFKSSSKKYVYSFAGLAATAVFAVAYNENEKRSYQYKFNNNYSNNNNSNNSNNGSSNLFKAGFFGFGAASSPIISNWLATETTHTFNDYQKIYNQIATKIQEEDEWDGGIGYGPVLVRLAWHLSGSYDKDDYSGTKGGSYGGTMRHKYEAKDAGNNGLVHARSFLNKIKQDNPFISTGDLYTLAGIVAIQEMNGPKIGWRAGRKDLPPKNQPPHGRLPNATQGAEHVRAVFNRMGFNDEEMVALIGVGHAIGRCHKENSGFTGPWTFSPNMVTNEFFKLILNERWEIKQHYDGNTQFEDSKTHSLMMLPTDMALIFDPNFKKISEIYSKNENLLFKDFANAFKKLLELGIEFPKDTPTWYFKTLDEQDD
ncbi:heme peroxidase [Ascoidea rubescens DSM 1968]|uniref:Peroxidase n=1 Tax=Ascoidea rubescens DSM 1968 TaxID=1344418 RepID=A0A1D2VI80_9ASCO|nr:heme peroxidase [Ascoidea rubescens DSM 1968]ODV61187.1 heme peroxidase [Ascoidea rubescens DSM 1968]